MGDFTKKEGEMLSVWKAAVLGIIQGATEFLPISSSGHLVVAQQLMGWNDTGAAILAFDIVLHIGTLVAVIAVLWRECLEILTGKNWRMFFYLIVATIPAVIIGLTLKDFIEGLFTSIATVGVAWIVTAVVLLLTKHVKTSEQLDVGYKKSFIIGCAQAIAIIPGISRSGSTIAAGLFSRLNHTAAAKFAFLMSIPAIAGAATLDAKNLNGLSADLLWPLLVGFVFSMITGYICIKWLLSIIKHGKLWYFGIYCLLAGILTLVLI